MRHPVRDGVKANLPHRKNRKEPYYRHRLEDPRGCPAKGFEPNHNDKPDQNFHASTVKFAFCRHTF
jgi:hypothetical protein